jgi:hypothetical protein
MYAQGQDHLLLVELQVQSYVVTVTATNERRHGVVSTAGSQGVLIGSVAIATGQAVTPPEVQFQ